MYIDLEKAHSARYGIGELYFLPDWVWDCCRSMIEDVDGTDWDDIQITDKDILSALEEVVEQGIKGAHVIMFDDDLSCWLVVEPDIPEGCLECPYDLFGVDDSVCLFDLGIEAEIPAHWLQTG